MTAGGSGRRPEHVPATILGLEDLAEHTKGGFYVLTLPERAGRGGQAELHVTRRGPVAVAYTDLETLVAACGTGQPWAWMNAERLAKLGEERGFTAVAMDPLLPDGHRYPETDERELPDLEPMRTDPGTWEHVYVPTRPVRPGHRHAIVELQVHRGRRALLAYGSIEALAAGCGPHQAWGAIKADDLPEVMAECGAERVLFNPVLGDEARHTAPVRDWGRS